MGTVRRLAAAAGDVTLGQAAEAYLATLRGAEQASTRRTYGRILRWVVAEFGVGTGPGEVDPERFTEWFTARWADRTPSTWNVSLDAVRAAAAYWGVGKTAVTRYTRLRRACSAQGRSAS